MRGLNLVSIASGKPMVSAYFISSAYVAAESCSFNVSPSGNCALASSFTCVSTCDIAPTSVSNATTWALLKAASIGAASG